MPGLFHGVDDAVSAAFVASRVQVVGLDYKTKTTYRNFCGLVRSDREEAVRLVIAVMKAVYGLVKTIAEHPDLKRTAIWSTSRGRYRTATELTTERIDRNLEKSEDLEVTVERAIVFAQGRNPRSIYDWYNQLNVAAGIRGSNSDKKTAIDILRVLRANRVSVDVTEFKQWSSKDHPFYTALEVFRYFCALLIFGKRGLDPHWSGEKRGKRWPDFERARLQILAPEDWFCTWDEIEVGSANATILIFRDALERLRQELPIVGLGYYFDKGLKLRGMAKSDFLSLLNSKSGSRLTSFKDLDTSAIEQINSWSDGAFQEIDGSPTSLTPSSESQPQPIGVEPHTEPDVSHEPTVPGPVLGNAMYHKKVE